MSAREDFRIEHHPSRGEFTWQEIPPLDLRRSPTERPFAHVTTRRIKPTLMALHLVDGIAVEMTVAAYVAQDGVPVVLIGGDGATLRLTEIRQRDSLIARLAVARAEARKWEAEARRMSSRARDAEAKAADAKPVQFDVWFVESWEPYESATRESIHRSARSAHRDAMRRRYAYAVEARETAIRHGWEPPARMVRVTHEKVEPGF